MNLGSETIATLFLRLAAERVLEIKIAPRQDDWPIDCMKARLLLATVSAACIAGTVVLLSVGKTAGY